MTAGRIVIVAEQPPWNWRLSHDFRRTYKPLNPFKGPGKLLLEASGLTRQQFLYGIERVDLIPDYSETWNVEHARINAMNIIRCHTPSAVFLLGRRVAAAFGFPADTVFPDGIYSNVLQCALIGLPDPKKKAQYTSEAAWIRDAFQARVNTIDAWTEQHARMLQAVGGDYD